MFKDIKDIAKTAFIDDTGRPVSTPSQEFMHLLENYGRWCREGLDVPRCKTSLSNVDTALPCYREIKPRSTLSDSEGLFISKALTEAKRGRPFSFWVFKQVVIHGRAVEDVAKTALCRLYLRRLGLDYKTAKRKGIKLHSLQKIRVKNLFFDFCQEICRFLR